MPEWSPKKNPANLRKHGLSLADASYVFRDEAGLEVYDWEHSQTEDRY
ncbi:MAG: BrnT family toxin [Pseudomonadota bacterium]